MTEKYTDADVMADGRFAHLVSRYHAWPMHQKQSTGEHSAQMYRIHCEVWGVPSAATAELIMKHDGGEIGTGDVPLYGKRDVPGLKPLMDAAEEVAASRNGMTCQLETMPVERWQVKMCDLLEGLEHSLVELEMGNRFALPVIQNYCRAIEGHLAKFESHGVANEVIDHLRKIYMAHEKLAATPVDSPRVTGGER